MQRIIGIDPGLTRCGIGIISTGSRRTLTFEHVEVLTSPATWETPARLHILGEAVTRLLSKEKPAAIALERVFAQQNLSSVMGVAQISGIIMYLAAKHGIPVHTYTPSQVKTQVTGYGNANKTQVTAMVTRILHLKTAPKPADAADALALAITHAWQNNSKHTGHTQKTAIHGALTQTPAQRAWQEAEKQARTRSR